MPDPAFVQKQVELLFKQWEFYENLTWRIPTMVITVNGGLLALYKLGQSHATAWIPFAMLFVGLITLVNAYRLHRANRLAKQILLELRVRFYDKHGVEGVVHTTRQMKWSPFTKGSSRTLTVWLLIVWGVFLLIASGFCFSQTKPDTSKTTIVEQRN